MTNEQKESHVYLTDLHAFSITAIGVLAVAALAAYAVSWAIGATP